MAPNTTQDTGNKNKRMANDQRIIIVLVAISLVFIILNYYEVINLPSKLSGRGPGGQFVYPTTTTTIPTEPISPTVDIWQTKSGSITSGTPVMRYRVDVTTSEYELYDFSLCPEDTGSDNYNSYMRFLDSGFNVLDSNDNACNTDN